MSIEFLMELKLYLLESLFNLGNGSVAWLYSILYRLFYLVKNALKVGFLILSLVLDFKGDSIVLFWSIYIFFGDNMEYYLNPRLLAWSKLLSWILNSTWDRFCEPSSSVTFKLSDLSLLSLYSLDYFDTTSSIILLFSLVFYDVSIIRLNAESYPAWLVLYI